MFTILFCLYLPPDQQQTEDFVRNGTEGRNLFDKMAIEWNENDVDDPIYR